jgi:hypothetical protein
MIIFRPSIFELKILIDIYANVAGNQIIPFDKNVSLNNLKLKFYNNAFIRGIEDNGEITAFIVGEIIFHPHLAFSVLQQTYYASIYKGIKAAKAVKLLHMALYEKAELMKIPLVMSMGSFLDETNVFTRILEKDNWIRTGYLACKKTSYWNTVSN